MATNRTTISYDNVAMHNRMCELALQLLENSSEAVNMHEFTSYFQSATKFPPKIIAMRTSSVLYALEKAGKIIQYPMCGYYRLSASCTH